MSNIFLIDLESVPTRYTCEWKTHLPTLLEKHGHNVRVISGPTDIPEATTPGAFLNFGGTNIYKSNQVEQLGRLFCANSVKHGDHFIFTDAWHPGIINLKYMSELLQIPVKIHALWHAGSYDPQDFLGRLIGDVPWVRYAEKSFFNAVDHNYFATQFHINMFVENLLEVPQGKITNVAGSLMREGKIVRTGWPMEYMPELLTPFNRAKRDLILFPHRIAPEKQVEIFKDLANAMPEYEWIVCQEFGLSKHGYHDLLGQAKMVFSANLQETLGISMYEGALVDAIPLVPDRLSYTEMYDENWLYPSEWTESFDSYVRHKDKLILTIRNYMTNYDAYANLLSHQAHDLHQKFFSATHLLEKLR